MRFESLIGKAGLSFLALGSVCSAAVIYTETWDTTAQGWTDSSSNMSVGYAVSGNPGGSLEGSFGTTVTPLVDGFYADNSASSGNFVGDYTGLTEFAGWRFDFFADDVLPSDFQMRLNGNGNTYAYNASDQLSSVGTWEDVFISATSGWFGPGGMGGFQTALGSVSWIEIRFTMGNTTAQTFHIDNFEISEDGPGGVAPEPSVFMAILIGTVIIKGFSEYQPQRIDTHS